MRSRRGGLTVLSGKGYRARVAVLVALAGWLLAGCGRPTAEPDSGLSARSEAHPIDPPAAVGAFAPNLATVGGQLAASWLEPVENAEGAAGHRLRFSRLGSDGWSEPVSIVEAPDMFANWADFPELVEAADGTLYAHWLAKTAADTYAYSVFLARSTDGGTSWEPMGKLNSDDTPTEHGFVAWVPEADGARAFWLDGRGMVSGGPMTLRSAVVGTADRDERVIDERVCECCGTDAAVTDSGAIVVYRDRSQEEIRDIFAGRRLISGWSEPVPVQVDQWRIEGCPVNGPAIDARRALAAVAWFTASEEAPRVQVAFSADSGATFGESVILDSSSDGALVLGRVDLALDVRGSADVSWVVQTGDHAEIRLQRVEADGSVGERRVVADTSAARASGFPVLRRLDNDLFLAWVEVGESPGTSRVRLRRV